MSNRQELQYRKISSDLRRLILDGEYVEGIRLPTESELSQEYGVGRQTVRHAYLELVNQGLVYRIPGKGSFVVPKDRGYGRKITNVDDLMALSSDTILEVITPLVADYCKEAAEELLLDQRALYSTRFLRLHKDKVFSHTTVYLPIDIGILLEDVPVLAHAGSRTSQTVIGMLSARGVDIHQADQTITAVASPPDVANFFGVKTGEPLLWVSRRYFSAEGTPIEYAVSYYLPRLYTHRVTLGKTAQFAR